MAKTRTQIPHSIQEQVLKEYNHLCAKCAGVSPHMHHIDNDPSNNDPLNLIPLCPNCHLIDQHDPTRSLDPAKLRLFRQYKDPTILTPQFEPLFRRMKFLNEIQEDSDVAELVKKVGELTNFVHALTMGEFYTTQLEILLRMSQAEGLILFGSPGDDENYPELVKKSKIAYRQQLRQARDEAYRLCVELLRYQNWKHD